MKLKYNNFLIISPVFLLVAIVLASFNYSVEKKEIMWGLHEELRSITVATTIFIKHKDGNISDHKDDILASFERIRSFDRVKRFILLQNNRPYIESLSDKVSKYKRRYKKGSKINYSELYQDKELTLIDAYMPIKKSSLALVVSLDASYVKEALENSMYKAVILVVGITFIGFIMSFILSLLVVKKIRRLSIIAKALARGKYAQEVKLGSIREFSDLGDTLDIMRSILQELLFKTRNSIIQEEESTYSKELLQLYCINCSSLKKINSSGIELQIAVLKENSENEFYNCFEDGNYIYAYFGAIEADNHSLEYSVEASSLNYYLKYFLTHSDVDINKLDNIYDISSLFIVKIDKNSKTLEFSLLNNKEVTSLKIELQESEIYSFTINESIKEKIEGYIKKYGFLNLEELSLDLAKLFKNEESVLLVRLSNSAKEDENKIDANNEKEVEKD